MPAPGKGGSCAEEASLAFEPAVRFTCSVTLDRSLSPGLHFYIRIRKIRPNCVELLS